MAWGRTRTTANKKASYTITEKELPGVPSDEVKHQSQGSWLRRICVNLWIWELLSLLVSITCIGAIVVILLRLENGPIPSWSYGLTLNGVISILAVITKASMVLPVAETLSQLKWCWFWQTPRPVRDFESFDLASRGPWGSLILLWKVRSCWLGAMGAIVTIAAMAMEPALQQIPAYPARLAIADHPSIGRSVNFTSRTTIEGTAGFTLSEGAKAATHMGIFGSPDTLSYTPPCTTGNCTWPEFDSLGVCSACHNLSSLLVDTIIDNEPNNLWWIHDPNDPNGAETHPSPVSRSGALLVQNVGLGVNIAYRGMSRHTIVDVQTLYWPSSSNEHDPPSGAFECILYFCVKTFVSSTTNGDHSERILSTWPLANTSVPKQPSIGPFRDGLYNLTLYAAEQRANLTLEPPDSSQTYTIDRTTFDLLQEWAEMNIFHGGISASDYGQTTGDFDIDDVAERVYDEMTATLGPNQTIPGSVLVGTSFNTTAHNFSVPTTQGPGRLMEQIATSLTTFMRQNDEDPMAIMGEATHLETYVKARWYWLACPVCLLLLAILFMGSTIVLSARRGIPIWKSSSLAVLVHGLDVASCRTMSDVTLDRMEQKASDHLMSVRRDRGLWTLQTH